MGMMRLSEDDRHAYGWMNRRDWDGGGGPGPGGTGYYGPPHSAWWSVVSGVLPFLAKIAFGSLLISMIWTAAR